VWHRNCAINVFKRKATKKIPPNLKKNSSVVMVPINCQLQEVCKNIGLAVMIRLQSTLTTGYINVLHTDCCVPDYVNGIADGSGSDLSESANRRRAAAAEVTTEKWASICQSVCLSVRQSFD